MSLADRFTPQLRARDLDLLMFAWGGPESHSGMSEGWKAAVAGQRIRERRREGIALAKQYGANICLNSAAPIRAQEDAYS
jgi:hypothetical protein